MHIKERENLEEKLMETKENLLNVNQMEFWLDHAVVVRILNAMDSTQEDIVRSLMLPRTLMKVTGRLLSIMVNTFNASMEQLLVFALLGHTKIANTRTRKFLI